MRPRSRATAKDLCRSRFSLNDPPTTEIYTLSLHDALPISREHDRSAARATDGWSSSRSLTADNLPEVAGAGHRVGHAQPEIHHVQDALQDAGHQLAPAGDRKSTRLNSSHVEISYAVFCLKK